MTDLFVIYVLGFYSYGYPFWVLKFLFMFYLILFYLMEGSNCSSYFRSGRKKTYLKTVRIFFFSFLSTSLQ